MLAPEELAGVMAHAFAHIGNRDTLPMTVTATFALSFRGRNSGLGLIGTIAPMILAPLAAAPVQVAIGRTRECGAGRVGAGICGDPRWLAPALREVAALARRIDMARAERNPGSAHPFIVNPRHARAIGRLFAGRPATAARVAARVAAPEAQAGRRGRPA